MKDDYLMQRKTRGERREKSMSFLRVKKFQISQQQLLDMFTEKLIAWSIINDDEDVVAIDIDWAKFDYLVEGETIPLKVTLKKD